MGPVPRWPYGRGIFLCNFSSYRLIFIFITIETEERNCFMLAMRIAVLEHEARQNAVDKVTYDMREVTRQPVDANHLTSVVLKDSDELGHVLVARRTHQMHKMQEATKSR